MRNRNLAEKPADLAYGAYQRGYYLTALDLALPRAEVEMWRHKL